MSPKRSDNTVVSNPASNTSGPNSPADHQTTTPDTPTASKLPPQVAGKKRRASGSGPNWGSRGVATLTPEQLAKKRANDRESQRAIRERTKNTIESLERRIQELTSQQPYQELQQAIQEKELVEAENADIKRRLAAVLNLIQPLLAGTSHGEGSSPFDARGKYRAPIHAALTREEGTSQPYSPTASTIEAQQGITRTYTGQWQQQGGISRVAHSRGSPNIPTAIDSTQRGRRQERASDEGVVPGLLRTTSAERAVLGLLPVGRPEIQAGDHLDEGRRPLSLPADSHITISSHSPPDTTRTNNSQSPPDQYSTIPPHTAPSCPLDSLLLDFISERRRMASRGATEEELVGGPYPDFDAIIHPERERRPTQQTRGISEVLVDILSTFPDISSPPEKVAVYYVMFLTMRWHVCPTQANYDRFPLWMRPTSWQVLTPHPVWVDHLPWPEMREELVRNHQRYPFENFFVPFTKTLSLNWTRDSGELFLPRLGKEGRLRLNPEYEAHIRDLKNWSLGSHFRNCFPYLSTHVRIEDRETTADGM